MGDFDLDKLLADENEYEAFVDKFKPKKTTDDCYTPDNIYSAVCSWVFARYELPAATRVVRPFWPGADYQAQEYPAGSVVIDNPPFSILAQIQRWFQQKGIRYFLFAPALTVFKPDSFLSYVLIDASIEYANGANVATSFTTNMADNLLESAPDLNKTIQQINQINRRKAKKELPKYSYPMELITASDVRRFAKHGIKFELRREEAHFVRKLDHHAGKVVFGAGFLISERAAAERAAAERAAAERAAAERAAAERAAAERAAATRWTLSERERGIVRALGKE